MNFRRETQAESFGQQRVSSVDFELPPALARGMGMVNGSIHGVVLACVYLYAGI
jgi:hypothetical protein